MLLNLSPTQLLMIVPTVLIALTVHEVRHHGDGAPVVLLERNRHVAVVNEQTAVRLWNVRRLDLATARKPRLAEEGEQETELFRGVDLVHGLGISLTGWSLREFREEGKRSFVRFAPTSRGAL